MPTPDLDAEAFVVFCSTPRGENGTSAPRGAVSITR